MPRSHAVPAEYLPVLSGLAGKPAAGLADTVLDALDVIVQERPGASHVAFDLVYVLPVGQRVEWWQPVVAR